MGAKYDRENEFESFVVRKYSVAIFLCIMSFAFGDSLKGISFLSSKDELNSPGVEEIEGIEFHDVNLPGPSDDLAYILSSRFINREIDECMVAEIKRAIVQFYRQYQRPVVTVIAPEQDTSIGVLQLIIVEAKVGEVEVRGNRYFSTCRLKDYFTVEQGDVIRADEIQRDLLFINRNPFRQADLIYAPGKAPGTTNIDLVVQDRLPVRFYTGIDNTGNSVTGNNRLFAGFSWGNVFNLDHLLSFQFSSSDDFKSFLGYVAEYSIPLPIKHMISLYGGYSTVDSKFEVPEAVGTHFHNSGYNAQGSFRYLIPLNPLTSSLQELSFGCDFKRMNNNLEFGGAPVFSKNVNLFQLMLSYNWGFESKKWVATFEIEGFTSPFQWLPDQTNQVYQTLRPFAKTRYVYGRASASLIHFFHSWFQYAIYLRGQAADVNLLPSEEYGVGGYDTVRGYEEREANGDDAFVGNFELVTRPFSITSWFGCKNGKDNLQLLGFFDYGAAFLHKKASGQNGNAHLYSVGPGLRYQYQSYLTARVDWGYQLHHITPGTPHQRLHFQLIGSY